MPREIEQHIAVFGQSGSGKTCLLSAFYGLQFEPDFRNRAGYWINSANSGDHQRLMHDYLNMKDNQLPPPTRYAHKAFEFDVTVKDLKESPGKLVWHDYPGEWWTETREGIEQQRKIDAFRDLLQSDVALILCDGAMLKQNGSKYIKKLIGDIRSELERIKNELAPNGKLKRFPRVWMICLSKSDLFPDKDVYWFRDEVIKAAVGELDVLRNAIGEIIGGDEFQSVGDDYLLLSSVKIDPETGAVVNMKEQTGVDLIMPSAFILPAKRLLVWKSRQADRMSLLNSVLSLVKDAMHTMHNMSYLPVLIDIFRTLEQPADKILKEAERAETEARKKMNSVEAFLSALTEKLRNAASRKVYCTARDVRGADIE
ncbi:MAG: hypothetical protein LBS70_04115 [Candidatus Accumulibacter sp.]|jgi:GTPase SAR1 family protein|nr:hypothetical protein [Accumulibacter sp.]